MTCAEVREHLPELVLGTLDGEQRASVASHVARCASCQADVKSLVRVTDTLWLAAPEAEPPAGFESRVLGALRPKRRFGWARTPWLAAAAALVLVVAGVVLVASRSSEPQRAAGPMRDRGRAVVGHAVVAAGTPAYVYVSVDSWGENGSYVVEVVRRDGTHVAVTPITITGGHGTAGGPLPVAFGEVRAVWVTDQAHTEWCSFKLRA